MTKPENLLDKGSQDQKIKQENVIIREDMDYQAADEANHLLQNGILVETSKGLVCMSLSDALSSNLNLSVEDLKNVATQLILQENLSKSTSPQTSDVTPDSDDPTSEGSSTMINKMPSHFIAKHHIKKLGMPISSASTTSKTLYPVALIVSPSSIVSDIDNANCSVSDSDASVTTSLSNTSILLNMKTDGTSQLMATPITNLAMNVATEKLPAKRRGGWPKGRKRKPELLHLPPKAPATGYNLYLNEMRMQFKDTTLAFHEVTKIIGNKWSSLTLNEKKPFLAKAEEEKKRYREELKEYRQSRAYQLYLLKKRRKRARPQYNVFSESDMDATDDIDDEDNEELYCRTCDQWFHNLHNKREHLQGRQHVQAVAGDMTRELGSDYDTDYMGNTSSISFSTSLDESSLDATPLRTGPMDTTSSSTVSECIANLISVVVRRERDIKLLERKVQDSKVTHDSLLRQVSVLKELETHLETQIKVLKDEEKSIENKLFHLWQVPCCFTSNISFPFSINALQK